jgi:hypothetical protein
MKKVDRVAIFVYKSDSVRVWRTILTRRTTVQHNQRNVAFWACLWSALAGLFGTAVSLQMGIKPGLSLVGIALLFGACAGMGAWLTLDWKRTAEGALIAWRNVVAMLVRIAAGEDVPRLTYVLCSAGYVFILLLSSISWIMYFTIAYATSHGNKGDHELSWSLSCTLMFASLLVAYGIADNNWNRYERDDNAREANYRALACAGIFAPLTVGGMALLGGAISFYLVWLCVSCAFREIRPDVWRFLVYVHSRHHAIAAISAFLGGTAGVIAGNVFGIPLVGGVAGGALGFLVGAFEERFVAPIVLHRLAAFQATD